MDWYNGYSPAERAAMGRCTPPVQAPCSMCGDPGAAQMQLHAEDYSRPYRWSAPSAYPVCRLCHFRLHRRFESPASWLAFVRFLRRGWYAQEVSPDDMRELQRAGPAYSWRPLPHPPPIRIGAHAFWWEALTLDAASKTSPSARPRPQGAGRDG